MTVIVCLAAVVAHKGQRVVRGDMLRMVLHELLGAVPESRNSLPVLVQTQDKAVLLIVFLHEAERIVVKITEERNGGFHAPVVFVVHEKRMAEKEARFETAHVAIADGAAVNDFALAHVLTDLGCFFLVNPFREGPVLLGNFAIERFAGHEGGGHFLESIVEWLIVQEDPVVIIAAVEAIFNLSDGFRELPHVAVPCQGDERGVGSRTRGDANKVIPARVIGRHGHREIFGIVVRHDTWPISRRTLLAPACCS